jgi:hypothetical protein
MTVLKRSQSDNVKALIESIQTLTPLLRNQKENDAADALDDAAKELTGATPGSPKLKEVVSIVIDAFEGDHELIAYTFQRESSAGQWTEAEELSEASNRVLALARRMQ